MTDSTLIYFGDAVKALDGGKVGGFVLRFGTPETADVQGDFFSPEGDYGLDISTKARVVYHHGLTRQYGPQKFGVADLSVKAEGIWGECSVEHPEIYADVEAGKLGWSSGSVDRLVSRKAVKGKTEIVAWPLIEVSLTPAPVDRRNRAIAIKSLIEDIEDIDPEAVAATGLLESTIKLVADAEVLTGRYAKAAGQRQAEGRYLSRDKCEAIKSLSDRLAKLAIPPRSKPDPERVLAMKRRLLAGRL